MRLLKEVGIENFTEEKCENFLNALNDSFRDIRTGAITIDEVGMFCEKEAWECVEREKSLSTRIGNLERDKRDKNNRLPQDHLNEKIESAEKQKEIYSSYQLALMARIEQLKKMRKAEAMTDGRQDIQAQSGEKQAPTAGLIGQHDEHLIEIGCICNTNKGLKCITKSAISEVADYLIISYPDLLTLSNLKRYMKPNNETYKDSYLIRVISNTKQK